MTPRSLSHYFGSRKFVGVCHSLAKEFNWGQININLVNQRCWMLRGASSWWGTTNRSAPLSLHHLWLEINVDLTPIKFVADQETITCTNDQFGRLKGWAWWGSQLGLLNELAPSNMIFPLLLSAALWLPLGGVYTQLSQLNPVFKQQVTFKPSEFQALNIKLDYGTSPEPQRLSRREKIALKLTQITKTITN